MYNIALCRVYNIVSNDTKLYDMKNSIISNEIIPHDTISYYMI